MFVVCVEQDQWERLVEFMGNPDWATLELFADQAGRAENQELVPEFLLPLVENSNLVGLTSLIVGGLARLIVASLTQKSHPPRPLDFSDME